MGEAKRKKDAGVYFGQPGYTAPEQPNAPDPEAISETKKNPAASALLAALLMLPHVGMPRSIRRRR